MTNKIEAGKTYNTAAGPADCIYVQGDLAWLRSHDDAPAYVWTLEGKAVSLATDDGRYDVIWEE